MATVKVSALTTAGSFLLADELPVNEAGTSKKVTGTQLQTALRGATPVRLSPSDPASRTGTEVMMGLGTTCVFTPTYTRVFVTFNGDASNSTLLDGVSVRGYYGTGTAPANAAAASGTAFSVYKTYTSATAAARVGFAISSVITGLTPATAYWFDLSVANVTGGAASLKDIDFIAMEI